MGEPSLVGALVRVAIVLLLLGATLRVVGRVTGRGRGAAGKGFVRRTIGGERRLVEVLERQSLGRTASVAVVRIGDRRVALGVTDQAVGVLLDLDQDPGAPAIETTARARSAPPGATAPTDPLDHDEPGDELVIDLRNPRTSAARTRAAGPRRPWTDLIEDLRERTIR